MENKELNKCCEKCKLDNTACAFRFCPCHLSPHQEPVATQKKECCKECLCTDREVRWCMNRVCPCHSPVLEEEKKYEFDNCDKHAYYDFFEQGTCKECDVKDSTQEPMEWDILEKLSELEHIQWVTWASSLIGEVSEERLNRWSKLLNLPYSELTELEKEEDRIWAKQVIRIVEYHIKSQIKQAEERERDLERKRAILVMNEFVKEKGENYPLGQYLNMLLELDKLSPTNKRAIE